MSIGWETVASESIKHNKPDSEQQILLLFNHLYILDFTQTQKTCVYVYKSFSFLPEVAFVGLFYYNNSTHTEKIDWGNNKGSWQEDKGMGVNMIKYIIHFKEAVFWNPNTVTLIYCWWDRMLEHSSLWFGERSTSSSSYKPLLGIYPENSTSYYKNTCSSTFYWMSYSN